ncbi:unnamed protein product [Schistocephalus solidus]|uniref:Uncharacterized protein n=1 Tax=Schistocephalus solidus TaxID=70667 RepID=A0A183TC55_SCHSO|nr:unnamed protein product [Schistocephalus solidus]
MSTDTTTTTTLASTALSEPVYLAQTKSLVLEHQAFASKSGHLVMENGTVTEVKRLITMPRVTGGDGDDERKLTRGEEIAEGVKRADQFPILDYFREAVKAKSDSKSTETSGSTPTLHGGSSVEHSLQRPASSTTISLSRQQQQQERQNPQSRMRQLEGLLQKKH